MNNIISTLPQIILQSFAKLTYATTSAGAREGGGVSIWRNNIKKHTEKPQSKYWLWFFIHIFQELQKTSCAYFGLQGVFFG